MTEANAVIIVIGYMLLMGIIVIMVLNQKPEKKKQVEEVPAVPVKTSDAVANLLSATNLTVVAMSLFNYPKAKSFYLTLRQGEKRTYSLRLEDPIIYTYELGADLYNMTLSSVTIRNEDGKSVVSLMYEEFDDISAELCWWRLTATLVDITIL